MHGVLILKATPIQNGCDTPPYMRCDHNYLPLDTLMFPAFIPAKTEDDICEDDPVISRSLSFSSKLPKCNFFFPSEEVSVSMSSKDSSFAIISLATRVSTSLLRSRIANYACAKPRERTWAALLSHASTIVGALIRPLLKMMDLLFNSNKDKSKTDFGKICVFFARICGAVASVCECVL